MRINLHPNSHNVTWPCRFEYMINDFMAEFRKEYLVNDRDVYRYFFSPNLERIQKLFADKNIQIEIYNIDDLPSREIIIADDDPTVVMYKLRYSDSPQES